MKHPADNELSFLSEVSPQQPISTLNDRDALPWMIVLNRGQTESKTVSISDVFVSVPSLYMSERGTYQTWLLDTGMMLTDTAMEVRRMSMANMNRYIRGDTLEKKGKRLIYRCRRVTNCVSVDEWVDWWVYFWLSESVNWPGSFSFTQPPEREREREIEREIERERKRERMFRVLFLFLLSSSMLLLCCYYCVYLWCSYSYFSPP